jgi:hypothetical protein
MVLTVSLRSHGVVSIASHMLTVVLCSIGPIKTSFGPVWAEMHLKIFEAAEKLGIMRNPETVSSLL